MSQRDVRNRTLAVSAIAILLLLVCRLGSGQQTPHPPIYNPYPPGIVPPDIESEIERVRRETRGIEMEAVREWANLPAPNPQGNPVILQGTGTAAIETLGKLMNFDESMSVFRNQACSSCHMPYAGFSGPIPSVNQTMVAYPGSFHFRANKRAAQRYTYAPFFPVLQYNQEQGLFFGGNFWDSRSTGYKVRSPDAEQAQHPPVDPGEMGSPDIACIAYKLSQARYKPLFEQVFGAGSLDIEWPADTERICSIPAGAAEFGNNPTPVPLNAHDRVQANEAYDHWAQSLNAYEQSVAVSAFSSKFDAFLKGNYTMTADEMAGFKLFNGKGNCNSCHLDGRGTTLKPSDNPDNSATAQVTPLFTCFGSANEGLPKNPRVAFYFETTPDSFGFTNNPFGFAYRDNGLGAFLVSGFGAAPNPNSDWVQFAESVNGQMQVSSARNVAMTPPQCPTTEAGTGKPYFQKEFFHNGYIKSLKELVHFYNTRDKFAYPVTSGHCPTGTTEKVDCWPMPEVPENIDTTTGNLGLTDEEENQIVVFLQTLTDGYTRPYPDLDTFTGSCKSGTGGSASVQ